MRRARAVPVIAAVLVLAGCAAIPTSGPVFENRAAAPGDESLVFRPNPPVAGADQLDIVRGFVQAASEGGSYDVAKQFLTPDFAKTWRPGARVLVHTTGWTIRESGDARAVLSVPLSARVDANGAYTPATGRTPVGFDLQQVNGQWRIAATADGIVLSQDVFQRTFVPKVLGFFDGSVGRLVPDRRWFLQRDDEDTAIVRALLAGPSDPLVDVVSEVFPEGTDLAARVDGDPGVRTVVLQTDGAPTAEQLTRMQQELAYSLQVTTASLRLVVNGRVAARAPQLQSPQPDSRPLVLANGRFGPLTASGVQQEGDLAKRIAASKPQRITVSARQGLAAVLTARGVEAVTATGAPRVVDDRQGLVAPSLDQRGWIFSVPAANPSGLIAVDQRGTVSQIASGLPVTAIRTIEVSPDGTRLLVVAEDGEGTTAVVAGIVRSADGTPVALSSATYPVSPVGAQLIAGTWVDDQSVALLAQSSDQQSVSKVQLGGFASDEGRLSDIDLLVGNTGSTGETLPLRALPSSGGLFERKDNDWSVVAGSSDVSVLAVQR